MRKVLFSAALFVFAFGIAAMAADISGTWAVKMQGPMGDENFDMVIKVSGESLTITANHPMLQELAGTGTLKGDEIKFKLEATGQMPVAFEFTGKVAGNKMSGTREIKMSGGPGGGPGGEGGPGGGPGGEGGPGGGMNMGQVSKDWAGEKK